MGTMIVPVKLLYAELAKALLFITWTKLCFMTMKGFKELSDKRKRNILKKIGVYLAERTIFYYRLKLYQINSFYVEVITSKEDKDVNWLKIFDSTEKLYPYLKQIDLSDLTRAIK